MTADQIKQLTDSLLAQIDSTASAAKASLDSVVQQFVSASTAARATAATNLASALAPYLDAPPPPPVATTSVPLAYAAISDRTIRTKPALPALQGAGFVFKEPSFGSTMMRVTDGNTEPSIPNRSFRTPSSTHAKSWSADSKSFYVVSTYGNILPFSFDAANLKAVRSGPEVKLFGEPNFHPQKPGTVVGALTTEYKLVEWDVATQAQRLILDLTPLAGFDLANPRTYIGDTGISNDGKRMFAFFGGTSQDRHFLLIAFDPTDPTNTSKRLLLNTMTGTVNGEPFVGSGVTMGYHLHSVNMDRSGRYLKLLWTGGDTTGPGPYWDLQTNTFAIGNAVEGGHDAYGFGVRTNNAADSPWDAAQWQRRSLSNLGAPTPLINPVLTPKELNLADHPSWHNAQPDALVPFISALYRYGAGIATPTAWRAWDDELIAVQTDVPAGGGATVWRFAHHRSDLAYYPLAGGRDPNRYYFWAMPRPQVSPDGRHALFTSNWEASLGDDPAAEDGGKKRQDVFLCELKGA